MYTDSSENRDHKRFSHRFARTILRKPITGSEEVKPKGNPPSSSDFSKMFTSEKSLYSNGVEFVSDKNTNYFRYPYHYYSPSSSETLFPAAARYFLKCEYDQERNSIETAILKASKNNSEIKNLLHNILLKTNLTIQFPQLSSSNNPQKFLHEVKVYHNANTVNPVFTKLKSLYPEQNIKSYVLTHDENNQRYVTPIGQEGKALDKISLTDARLLINILPANNKDNKQIFALPEFKKLITGHCMSVQKTDAKFSGIPAFKNFIGSKNTLIFMLDPENHERAFILDENNKKIESPRKKISMYQTISRYLTGDSARRNYVVLDLSKNSRDPLGGAARDLLLNFEIVRNQENPNQAYLLNSEGSKMPGHIDISKDTKSHLGKLVNKGMGEIQFFLDEQLSNPQENTHSNVFLSVPFLPDPGQRKVSDFLPIVAGLSRIQQYLYDKEHYLKHSRQISLKGQKFVDREEKRREACLQRAEKRLGHSVEEQRKHGLAENFLNTPVFDDETLEKRNLLAHSTTHSTTIKEYAPHFTSNPVIVNKKYADVDGKKIFTALNRVLNFSDQTIGTLSSQRRGEKSSVKEPESDMPDSITSYKVEEVGSENSIIKYNLTPFDYTEQPVRGVSSDEITKIVPDASRILARNVLNGQIVNSLREDIEEIDLMFKGGDSQAMDALCTFKQSVQTSLQSKKFQAVLVQEAMDQNLATLHPNILHELSPLLPRSQILTTRNTLSRN